jgi:two-component system sensor histidine kinase UhpB
MDALRDLNRRLPVFWKIQIANSAFLLAATWAGAWAGARARGPGILSAGLGVSAAALAVAASALLLRVALRPLERVVATMAAVSAGNAQARAEADGDPWASALARSLNGMLDRLGAQEREAARAAMRAEDDERRRIARELHDDTCQRLARLTSALQDRPDRAREALDILEGLRRSMAALHPAVLDDLGFGAALRSLAAGDGPPAVHVEVHAADPADPEAAHAAYRVAQEALTNARRHAGASNVWVRWDANEDGKQLQVEDDGCGLPAVAERGAAGSGHYGLRGMRARARAIGGHLFIDSARGRGTIITLTCPEPAEAPATPRRSSLLAAGAGRP